MITLNLVYPEKSNVKIKTTCFPDKQQQVEILDLKLSDELPIKIVSRLSSFMDLELICCAVESLIHLGVQTKKKYKLHLFVPYFLGARSDRSFSTGSSNYLSKIISPQINNLKFESVTVLDPHSDVIEGCLNNFIKIDNKRLVEDFIVGTNAKLDDFILISPDSGSLKKIYKIADNINYTGDILVCTKSRDEQGKLTKTEVPVKFEHEGKNLVIIDDICDGGATFINIAKEINKQFEGSVTKNKIYLIVSHGIFSKGFGELSQYFEAIYTTNSYKDFLPDTNAFIKQCNLF